MRATKIVHCHFCLRGESMVVTQRGVPICIDCIEKIAKGDNIVASQAPSGEVMAGVESPKDVLEELFTYHEPTDIQKENYRAIRSAALVLARIIDAVCPPGPDRTAAVRKIREAVMTANASIATNNAQYR
ncbi:MAG TPA: hypothetical protein VJQ53_04770 [Candidatus Eisenbacteria bacterium]|nr:hypothetical protein [Candidatus Eisenbacteria bacterium]